MIVWVPTARAEVLNLAMPLARLTVPRSVLVEASLKLTIPVGVPTPGATGVTLAMKVADSPETDAPTEAVTTAVVSA